MTFYKRSGKIGPNCNPEADTKTAPAQNIAITASLILRRDLKITAATAKPTIEPSKNSAAMMIDAKPAVADIVYLPSTASERTGLGSTFCCELFQTWRDECVGRRPDGRQRIHRKEVF